MGQNWTVGTFPLVNTILTIQLMSKRKILVHLYYCSAFFKCCKKDVQSIRISFTIIFLCLNRFSKNILKSDFSEIRVRSWVQVVSRQRNRPLIGWSIWSTNSRPEFLAKNHLELMFWLWSQKKSEFSKTERYENKCAQCVWGGKNIQFFWNSKQGRVQKRPVA